MKAWADRITAEFDADLARIWVALDPDDVLVDESLLAVLRGSGFEVTPYEDPLAFRAEYEERYRAAWDQGIPAPARALILHVHAADANSLPWDILAQARLVRLSLAELFPRLAYGAVKQVEPEHYSALFDAHQSELQSTLGDAESRDFILDHVYFFNARSMRRKEDFWRELLRLHFANRALPEPLAEHAASILHRKELVEGRPIVAWLSSRSAMARVLQDAWGRYLAEMGLGPAQAADIRSQSYHAKVEVPFEHSDIRALVDSLFLDGTLSPVPVKFIPANLPGWVKAGIVEDTAAAQAHLLKGVAGLAEALPSSSASHKDWVEFARRYAEVLARYHALSSKEADAALGPTREGIHCLQVESDKRLREWVAGKRYADLILQPATHGPAMVHHIPRFLRHRRASGELKVALLVFDGLAYDQWVLIREQLRLAGRAYGFDERGTFAWVPTLTSVSRQALFSGLKPREFDGSIDRTDKEESLWKTFWQNEGVNANEVMYRRALRQTHQLDALEADLIDRRPKVVGLVIDEVDDRLHKERSKKDVAMWIGNWLTTGFVDRMFSLLLNKGFHVYLTADHGNVESTGVGRPSQGVIAETRGERVRVYRSEPLLADSAAAYPTTVRLDIAGLPANFMPLFAGGRTAFVPVGEQVVVHGGVSVEELIVPFVKVSYDLGVA